MAQTAALRVQSTGDVIDYTPTSAVTAGNVVVIGTIPMIATQDIEADVMGSLACAGVFDVPQASGGFTRGDAVYWDADGSPNTGTALSGAATATATGNTLMGFAVATAATGDTYVRVSLTTARRTATIAGSVEADDVTGSDSTLAIAGAPGSSSAGGLVSVTGGVGSTGAGGAASLVGGAGNGTTNVGGAAAVTGGAGAATGAGGTATVAGGAGGATSGTGGAVTVKGGAGTNGNANGGALNLLGGAKHGSGADGAINIGGTNTASVTFGKMPRIPTATVAAAGTIQGDAAAVVEGFTLVTGSTNAGVILPAAVAGMQVIIKNNVAGNMKVWPNTSDAINAIAADGAYTMGTVTCALFVAYDATTWYSLSLVAS